MNPTKQGQRLGLLSADAYLDAGLWEAGGLGQALPKADARVGVRLERGPQELHVLLGEAGSLPAAGAAGRGPGRASRGHLAALI